MQFDLRLQSGKVVVWEGSNAQDAARRYVEAHRGQVVTAWRQHSRHGVFVWGGQPVLEPTDRH